MMASDDEKRKRDLRCAACARNASRALLACVSNLPRTYATRPDPTADPFGPPKLLSDAPFGDKPRDALARALADLAREKVLTAPSACDVLAPPLTKGSLLL